MKINQKKIKLNEEFWKILESSLNISYCINMKMIKKILQLIWSMNTIESKMTMFFLHLLIYWPSSSLSTLKEWRQRQQNWKKKIEFRVIQQNKIQKQIIFLQSKHLCKNQKCLNVDHYCWKNSNIHQYFKLNNHNFVVWNKTLNRDEMNVDANISFFIVRQSCYDSV